MTAPGINPLKLFVGGLSWGTVDATLYEEFGRYGAIDEAIVVRDKLTGKSRGFGFVRFQQAEDAQRAKEATDGQPLDGRVVRVDFASEKRRVPGGGIGVEGGAHFYGGPGMLAYGGMLDMSGQPVGYMQQSPYLQDPAAMSMQPLYPQQLYPGAGALYGYAPHALQQHHHQQQQQFLAMQQQQQQQYQRNQMQQQHLYNGANSLQAQPSLSSPSQGPAQQESSSPGVDGQASFEASSL